MDKQPIKVFKFTLFPDGYKCNQPGNNSGEYVGAVGYEAMESRASSAESSLAAMRQRTEESEKERDAAIVRAKAAEFTAHTFSVACDAYKSRAERAESCLRRVQRLADDGVDDPAGPHNVLAQIANTVEAVLSSPPADASKMGGEREQRLACLLKEAVMNVGSLQLDRSAAKWVCDVQSALAEMEQKS